MCGILAVVYKEDQRPCAQKTIDKLSIFLIRRGHDKVIQNHFKLSSDWYIGVLGCVLHMRGLLTPQPFQNVNTGDWLLWNGEIFASSSFVVDESENDTSVLLKSLSTVQTEQDTTTVFNGIHGPWSMIYYQANSQSLWFGRDILGRRSLVWHIPINDRDLFIVSSVGFATESISDNDYWQEVPTHGIYRIPLSADRLCRGFTATESVYCYAWKEKDSDIFYLSEQNATDSPLPPFLTIDKTVCLTVPFQTINKSLTPVDGYNSTIQTECSQHLLYLLQESVKIRISAWNGSENIGILFSGGLDSVILAALADKCLDSIKEIDLINVAFSHNDIYNVAPDRIAAIEAIEELNKNRKWNLILVNISSAELTKIRQEHIHHLIHPLNTVMDDSIGCALWFAARGKGILYTNGEKYESNSKVLLIGMGADEQFGGYSRHRTAYQKGGWACVLEEVTKDIHRISTRNLGRDDRCISDHHREGRYPYLDERVIDYVNSLPIWMKTDYSYPRGLGEKIILRKVASQLGLTKTAGLAKKAIQFGSHIAKISGSTGIQHSGQKPLIVKSDCT